MQESGRKKHGLYSMRSQGVSKVCPGTLWGRSRTLSSVRCSSSPSHRAYSSGLSTLLSTKGGTGRRQEGSGHLPAVAVVRGGGGGVMRACVGVAVVVVVVPVVVVMRGGDAWWWW